MMDSWYLCTTFDRLELKLLNDGLKFCWRGHVSRDVQHPRNRIANKSWLSYSYPTSWAAIRTLYLLPACAFCPTLHLNIKSDNSQQRRCDALVCVASAQL